MQELEDYAIFHNRSRLEKSLNTLKGVVQGISIDGQITDAEMQEMLNWTSLQAEFANKHPYTELLPLIDTALCDGKIDAEECSDILWVCNNFMSENKYYDYVTASLQQLNGIIHGILADNHIDNLEISRLLDWVRINDFLSGTYPYDELESILTSILADRKVTDKERLELKAFLGDFIDIRDSYNITQAELDALKSEIHISGICALCPDIIFEEKVFCFTGISSRMQRDEICEMVLSRNGIFVDSVSSKTDYLVVGNGGNPCWAFSCYGRKVEKAVDLRKKGKPIKIVHENDFLDALI